jgi:hypothetical protein
MSLRPPYKVEKLQKVLRAKAKESPGYRFYQLYDKVYREDVLAFAYICCKTNGGAAGVDDQTFEDIEAYGRDRWLSELAQELRSVRLRFWDSRSANKSLGERAGGISVLHQPRKRLPRSARRSVT